MKLMQETSVTQ